MTSKFRLQFAACLAVATLLFVASSRVGAGETVIDKKRGFQFKIPAGFEPNKGLGAFTADTLYSYVKNGPANDIDDLYFQIERLHGIIGRERLKPEYFPPESKKKLFTEHWQGFEVDAVEVRMELLGHTVLTYNVQIPIKGEAIQIKVAGLDSREAELKQVLAEVLEGLEGESNWSQSSFPKLGAIKQYGPTLVGCGIGIVVGFVGFILMVRKGWNWIVFAISLSIYIGSRKVSGMSFFDVKTVVMSMRILAAIGGVLWLVGLNLKLEPSKQPQWLNQLLDRNPNSQDGDAPKEPSAKN